MKDCFDQIQDSLKVHRIFYEVGTKFNRSFGSKKPKYSNKCLKCGKRFRSKSNFDNCEDHKGYREVLL